MNRYSEEQIAVLEKVKIECADIEELMGEYADGEMIPTLKERFDEHFEGCESCQAFAWSYHKTIQLAGEIKDKPLPEGAGSRLRAALNARLGLTLNA